MVGLVTNLDYLVLVVRPSAFVAVVVVGQILKDDDDDDDEEES